MASWASLGRKKPDDPDFNQPLKSPASSDVSAGGTVHKKIPQWLYGTFESESPTGWMLELNRYLGDFQLLVWLYVILAIVLSLIWGMTWIVGIVVAIVAQKLKRTDLASIAYQCFFATAMGMCICTPPSLIVFFWPGGPEDLLLRVEKNEMANMDIQTAYKAQIFLMLIFYFCLMYQDVNEQVVEVKEWMKPYLKKSVKSLDIIGAQRKIMTDYLKENEMHSQGDIVDLLTILESLPGWGSTGEQELDAGQNDGFFKLIHQQRAEAHANGLFGLDMYTLRQWKYTAQTEARRKDGDEAAEFSVKAQLCDEHERTKKRCGNTFHFIFGYLLENHMTLAIVTVLALIRCWIPRLWLRFYVGGLLLPHDAWPFAFVIASMVTIFICYFCFMGVFMVLIFEYESNAHQIALLTSVISMDARCTYEEKVLVNRHKLTPEEAEPLMGRLPLLNLKKSKNAVGFWNLRNYVLMDRANDRVGMQILISISILLILLNIILAVYDLWHHPDITPFIPVVLFDVVVMGILILFALQQALIMNNWMQSHVQYFNQAIHDIMSTKAEMINYGTTFSVATYDEADKNKTHDELLADLALSKQFLRSAVTMVHENDPREALLFGVEVTPGGLVTSAAGVAGSAAFFLYQMLKSGVNPLDEMSKANDEADQKARETAVKATKFLIQYAMAGVSKLKNL